MSENHQSRPHLGTLEQSHFNTPKRGKENGMKTFASCLAVGLALTAANLSAATLVTDGFESYSTGDSVTLLPPGGSYNRKLWMTK